MSPNAIWLVSFCKENIKIRVCVCVCVCVCVYTQRKDHVKTRRRWSSLSQGKRTQIKINPAYTLVSDFHFQNHEKIIFCCLSPQSAVSCYGSSNWLIESRNNPSAGEGPHPLTAKRMGNRVLPHELNPCNACQGEGGAHGLSPMSPMRYG